MIRRISALLVSLAVCINLAWSQPAAGAVDYSIIRVMLSSMGTPDKVVLRVQGCYSIPQIGDELIDEGSYEIYVEGDELILKQDSTSRAMGNKFTFKNQDNSFVSYLKVLNNSYGWTNYLGDMEVRLINGGIHLINHVFLEYYLYGVVPYEMDNSWPLEALKAQTIAARTYAVRCKTSLSYFDVYDTENSQIYRGYNPSKQNAIQAVNETYGMILKYGADFASTYYYSSNGGKTESSKNLWGEYIPYLIAQEDPFDVLNPENPNAAWKVEYSKLTVEPALQARIKARMQSYLESAGYSGNEEDIRILQIKELSFDPPNDSGRMEKGRLVVVADVKSKDDGSIHTLEYPITLTKSNIRTILNVKSLLFAVEETAESYIIKGSGYGHGVGMSQFGAQYMALEGLSFSHILGFYYPGTRIETLSIIPPYSRGDDRSEDPQDSNSQDSNESEQEDPDLDEQDEVEQEDPDLEDQNESEPDHSEPEEGLEDAEPEKPRETEDSENPGDIETEDPEEIEDPEDTEHGNPDGEDLEAPNQNSEVYGTVNVTTSLNVRQGPGLQYAKISSLSPGTRIQILEQGKEWHRIKVGELEGYVSSQYIIIENREEMKPQDPDQGQNPVKPEEDPAPPPDKRYGIVVASALNIRSGPSTRNHKVGMVIRGTRLEVLEKSGLWYKIKIEGLEGYVHGDYLELENKYITGRALVTASSLNLRDGAGLEHQIMDSLPRGTEIELLEKQGIWYKIKFGEKVGFVHGGYLNIIQDINNTSASTIKTGAVNASALNVRTGPGLSYPRIALLYRGDKVTILKEVDGWYQIQQGSITGYVSSEYVHI